VITGYRMIAMLLLSPVLCGMAIVRPFAGLIALVIMYYTRPDVWGPPWFRPQMWLTVAVGIGWIAQGRPIRFPPLLRVAAVIAALCFVNAAFAVDTRAVALDTALVILKLFVVMVFTVNLVDTPERAHSFLWANVVGMIYNLKAIYVEGLSSGGVSDDRVDVGVGQGGGANYIAMILAMTLPFLYMRILNGRGWERFLAISLAPLYVVGIVLTGSRGGFLSLGAVAMVMLFKSNRKGLGAAVLCAMLLLFVVVVPAESIARFKQGVGVEGERDRSAEGRIRLWVAAVEMFVEYPLLGVGLDNYQHLSPKYVGVYAGKGEHKYIPGVKGRGFVTHSTWFQMLAEGGILLSIPFFLMFPMAWSTLRKVARSGLSPPAGPVLREQALVLEGAFVGFVVSSTFGSHFKIDFMWWYFGAVAALWLIAKDQALREAARGGAKAARPAARRPVEAVP
jgi:O-antigen ligase